MQFSRRREGKGGRENPPAKAHPLVASAHAPRHCAWGGEVH